MRKYILYIYFLTRMERHKSFFPSFGFWNKHDIRFPGGVILRALYSKRAGRRRVEDAFHHLSRHRLSGSVAGDIDKSALSALSISINHYNDPSAQSRQGSKYRCYGSGLRDVHHSVISRDLGSPVIIKLLSSLRKVSDTVRVPFCHLSCPRRSFISFVPHCA